uniref:Flavin-containing monooxygenase n=1 Tax=Ditylenchus dipsaci TaxID=166011 RepID=A0A915DGP9_9BILA
MVKKRVAIVGAGASGITAARQCVDYGFEPVIFEKSDVLGGILHYSEDPQKHSVMHSTVMKYSTELSVFSDFPAPKGYPEFMHHTKALKYLEDYANNFNLLGYLKLNTEVCQITRSKNYSDSGTWMVEYFDVTSSEKKVITTEFDAVLICTGMHARAWRPPVYRLEKAFKGRVIDSQNYKNSTTYLNKTVVIVGFGNSAVDIACDLAPVAKQVYITSRRSTWLLDQLDSKKPWDLAFNRKKSCSEICEELFVECKADKISNSDSSANELDHPFLSCNFTFSNCLQLYLASGRVLIKPNLLSFAETGVELEDRSIIQNVDEVIFATGYDFDFSIIENGRLIRVRYNDFHLFQHMYLPGLLPTLAVIGHVQPRGSLWPVAEMQARYFFHTLSGQTQLPTSFKMKEELEKWRCYMSLNYLKTQRHTQIEDFVVYMDRLASYIGVQPDMFSLLWSDPRLAFQCFFGPCISQQYRLGGAHACPSAREIIMNNRRKNSMYLAEPTKRFSRLTVNISLITIVLLLLLWLLF